MALNTSVQPFIQKMLMPADADGAGEALVGAFKNFAGAYVAAKEGKRAQQSKKATNPQSYDEAVDGVSNPPDKPGRFENFAKAYLGAQGQVAMGANPELRPQVELLNQRVRQGYSQERTLNSIAGQNPMQVAQEIGNLEPSKVPGWLTDNTWLLSVPWGKSMWEGLASRYGESEQAKISSAKAKATAERQIQMTQQGLNSDSESDNVVFNRNNAFKAASIAAKTAERSFDPSLLEPGWVDGNGRINDEALYKSIAKMPVSQSIESKELIAQMRVDAANNRATQGQAFAPSMFEREILFREQRLGRKLTAEEFKVYDDLESGVRPKASVGLDRSVLKDKIDRKKELQKQMDGLRGSGSADGVAEMKQIRQAIQRIDSEIDTMVGSGADTPSNPRLEPLEGGKLRYVPK